MARCQAGSERTYGVALRERRLAAGLTQRELAEAGGASVAAIRDLEQGRTRCPRPLLATRLAEALRLDPDQAADLLAAGQDPPPTWPTSGNGHQNGTRLRVLGPVAAWRDGIALELGGPRQRAVVGLLAVHHGTGVHRDAIVDALWGDDPPRTSVNLVQAYASRLRQILDPGRPRGRGLLTSSYGRYTLHVQPGQLDLLAFGGLAARAGAMRTAGNPAAACDLYEQALSLWRAEPLADIAVLRQHPAIVDLSRVKAAVVRGYADAAFDAGRPDLVIRHLHELAGRDLLDEAAHAKLMIALAATGQQAAALAVYDRLVRRLDDQLGVRPGQELNEAQLQVLRQELPRLAAERKSRRRPQAPQCSCMDACRRHPPSAGQVPRQLPAGTAPFTGRKAELRRLSMLLTDATRVNGTARIVVIGGIAGVGKTALAIRWAQQVAHLFPDGQLFANLRGSSPARPPMAPGRVIGRFLRALGVPAPAIPANLEARADTYRSVLASKRMLIVLDDAKDAGQARALLPGGPGCLVVITSRNRLTTLIAREGAWPLALDVLTESDGADLLARRLGSERIASQPRPTHEIIRLCAGLPLALSLAATIAATRPNLALEALAAELRDPSSRLDVLDGGDQAAGLVAAFSSSYTDLSDHAARMFRVLARYPGQLTSVQAAARLAQVPLPHAQAALRELTSGNMLAELAPGRFTCHDLLRCYAARQDELDRHH